MIVVRVELWPGGDERHKETLGLAVIGNDGTGDIRTGNYDVWLSRRGAAWHPGWWRTPRSVWKHARVEGFPRRRLLAWDLLYRALVAAVGERE